MKILKYTLLASVIPFLVACPDDDNNSPGFANSNAEFSLRVINLTNNQPLSPIAVVMHQSGYVAFTDGETASVDLETLAEGGDNSGILSSASSDSSHLTSTSGSGPVGPRQTSETFSLSIPSNATGDLRLTMLSMLVNTNDAFTGLNAVNISNMSVGQSLTFNGPTWDSGTEANSEASGTIPGPADSSVNPVGFDAARTDNVDRVRFHSGVVTSDDGLITSILNESHRFDNPSSRVILTRTQ